MAGAVGISPASVRRIWKRHGLKPHLVRTFKVSTDPHFVQKLEEIVGLYLSPPDQALVFSVDEKSQIQVLDRTQPGLPLKKGQAGTMTHDYKRHGTTTLFAALCTLTGQVISTCMPRHRHQEWIRFLNLIEKGLMKRGWNRSRSIEVLEGKEPEPVRELPLMGYIAAGTPLEAVLDPTTIALPWTEAGARNLYVLQVKGQSMIDDHIEDGDFVIIEERKTANNGETVVALLDGNEATLKRYYRENGHVRLQPANPTMEPIIVRDGEFKIQGIVVGILRKY